MQKKEPVPSFKNVTICRLSAPARLEVYRDETKTKKKRKGAKLYKIIGKSETPSGQTPLPIAERIDRPD